MICFSINKPNSFDNVKVKWKPELHKHAADVPIVLVGTQCDLKNSNSTSEEAGKQLAIDIGATEYIECSAKTRKNLQDVFKACVRAYYAKLSAEKEAKQRKKSICTVL
jgi:Ras-related C3 botulinum toxin substrate 1